MDSITILAVIGFILAAYSIVANDAIQTLGTFLASNSHRPWWVLWIFAGGVLTATLYYGWLSTGGDPAYGRLAKFPFPEMGIQWYHVLPPFVILILTRIGIPVSTTFLVLTVFNAGNLGGMLQKSLLGYGVAFAVACGLVYFLTGGLEKRFKETNSEGPKKYWVTLQWLSTGYLWSMWLIQDLANIFAYLPRTINGGVLAGSLALMLVLLGIVFYQKGGSIQKIVTTKTNTTDIRSATIIDFIFATILLVFKEWNSLPMSTTWVFLGLLAGRELAMQLKGIRASDESVWSSVGKDAVKALIGLAVSVGLAFLIPAFA